MTFVGVILPMIEPSAILSYLGLFSLVATVTPTKRDDKLVEFLREKPGYIKHLVTWFSDIVNTLGFTKKGAK